MNTILYIEDDNLNRNLLNKHLRRFGMQMLEAVNGLSGLELAVETAPDLIFLDMHLPDMHGLEVLACLRTFEKTATLKIVALTADAMHGDRQRYLQAGFDNYLAKPITKLELINVLRLYFPEDFELV
jgi:CheY-like chemotaxis protein